VAERSVAIANKGNEVVHNTITGMDNIREQIQDTAKRIKRLGESSQEIGDIVSLIDDIADQTNILALNAAIQASMAGDAGAASPWSPTKCSAWPNVRPPRPGRSKRWCDHSDRHQRSGDLDGADHPEVVRGARLAQDAGVALEEIEGVSKTLAALIQNISNAARQQTSSAGHISNTMNVIQEITSQTSPVPPPPRAASATWRRWRARCVTPYPLQAAGSCGTGLSRRCAVVKSCA
jgi:twitching motility protein PilJ